MTAICRRGVGTLLVLAAAGAGACVESDPEVAGSTFLVSAAASLSDAIGAVADAFESETGIRVLLNVAGSHVLATQLIAGAPVDLFVSADARQMARAAAARRIDPEQRIDLLSNQLVAVVPDDRIDVPRGPRALADPAIRRLALGDPEAVPAGVYAREYLETLGLWPGLVDRVVPMQSVRAALRAVESGTADAGIVYRTDLRTSSGARLAFEVPVEGGPRIVYPAAVAATPPNPDGARRFFAFLQSETARRLFENAGFLPLAIDAVGTSSR